MSAATIYWHGGQAGLAVGAYILPPSETGATNTLYETAQRCGLPRVARRDRVYVVTDFGGALLYAAVHPSRGHVYEVEPVGRLTPDPDCDMPGLSWECDRARIVRVVVPTKKQVRMVLRALAGGAR